MLWYMMLSLMIAVLVAIFTILGILVLSDFFEPVERFFAGLYNSVGPLAPSIAYIIAVFITTFFILSIKTTRYIDEISRSVNIIAKGDLDISVPVKGHDEFSVLAQNINGMTEQLRYSFAKQKEMEENKAELITNVAHDLRTPLTSIIGYLQLINDEKEITQETTKKYASIAYNKSLKLQRLIDDLFDYTRYGNSGMTIKHDNIDMSGLLVQLAEEYYPVFQSAGMVCRLNIQSHILVSGDGDLLARVFDNLFNNAIKYGKDGKICDVYAEKQDNTAIFHVISYGEEIPNEKLERIFDKFYRVEQSRSQEHGGTGLGLPIARSIIRLHGGEIFASSSNGRTVFSVIIPVI